LRKITLGYLNISDQGKKYVNDCLDRNRLSYGDYTAEFESRFAELHGCEHGIFMNSGTSALQVALAALKEVHGYKDGDEIIVPATTFIATSNIVIQNGLKPVFVDVDPFTFNMGANKLWDKVKHSPRVRAVIPVHLFGLPSDMIEIESIANEYALQIIEDSCETMFAGQNGISVGSFGDLSCFSTYIAHLIVGGVGGIVTTDDDKLAEICRSLMAHGRDSIYTDIDSDDGDDDVLRRQMIERRFKFDRLGYSYRATELEAAIALSELEQYQDNIFTRRVNATLLTDYLNDLDVLQLPYVPKGMTHSFMMYPMVLKKGNRDDFLMHLERNGIETRYLFPLLDQPIYRKLFPGEAKKYPVAQHLAKQGFYIGCHKGLTTDDIQYVSDVIHGYFE
jgi:CDP-6-deoxy-D-xylo-4-hexulose-3-dehydrase